MLVLSRRKGERIHVGNDIVITITRIQNGKVSVGIDAPRHLDIARAELEPVAGNGTVAVERSRKAR